MFAHKKPRKRHWGRGQGGRWLRLRKQTHMPGGERGGNGRVRMYTGEVVREGWRKFGVGRKAPE